MNIKMLVVLIIIAAVCLVGAVDVVDAIVAIVNDDIITLTDIKEEYETMSQILREQAQGKDVSKELENMKNALLDTMVTNLLVLQEAKKQKIDVSEHVKATIDNIKTQNNWQSDQEMMREFQRQGMDFEEWKKDLVEQTMRQSVIFGEIRQSMVIEDSQLIEYYKKNPDEFTEPTEYHLKAVYIDLAERTPDDMEIRKKEISDRLSRGDALEDVAAELSDGPQKESRGELGSFKKGEMNPALEKAVEELSEGDLSPWIDLETGFIVVKLEEKKDRRLKSFDEARREIEESLARQKEQALLQAYVEKLKKKSYIKILIPNPLENY